MVAYLASVHIVLAFLMVFSPCTQCMELPALKLRSSILHDYASIPKCLEPSSNSSKGTLAPHPSPSAAINEPFSSLLESDEKTVAVIGTTFATYKQLVKDLGELIAKRGYNLVTANKGGNMDEIRRVFKSVPNHKGKSIFSKWQKKKDESTPENVDETQDFGGDNNMLLKADVIVVLPGGPYVVDQMKFAKEKNKPLIVFLTDDTVTFKGEEDKEFVANKLVKDAAASLSLKATYTIKDVEDAFDTHLKVAAEGPPTETPAEGAGAEKSPAEGAGEEKSLAAPKAVCAALLLVLFVGFQTV